MATDRWQQFGIDYPEILAYLIGQVSHKFVADHRLMDLITLVNCIPIEEDNTPENDERAAIVHAKVRGMLFNAGILVDDYEQVENGARFRVDTADVPQLSTLPIEYHTLWSNLKISNIEVTAIKEAVTDNTIIVLNPAEERSLRSIGEEPRDAIFEETYKDAVKWLLEYGFIVRSGVDNVLYITKAGEQWLAEHDKSLEDLRGQFSITKHIESPAIEDEPTQTDIDHFSQRILENGVPVTNPNNPYYLVQERLDGHTVVGYRVFRDKTCVGGFGMNESAAKIAVQLLNEETHQLRERIAELEDVIREAYRVATDTGYETPALCLSYVIAELKDSIHQQ